MPCLYWIKMIPFGIHRSYLDKLDIFLDNVENDVSSILYHTRVFDVFMLDGIENYYSFENRQYSIIYMFSDSLDCIMYFSYMGNPLLTLIRDFGMMLKDIFHCFNDYLNSKFFSNSCDIILSGSAILVSDSDYAMFVLYNSLISASKFEVFALITDSIDLILDLAYQLDVCLILFEVLVLSLIFILIFGNISKFIVMTKFYDNIVNLLKYNNISMLEMSITCTLFLVFNIFDISLSFTEDDSLDTFFYLILIFIITMFFFISIGMDIQYYYSMSNSSNGDVSLRLLFSDILNNFLGILRIFLCWIRYILYDLQVEMIDFPLHYVDYTNEVYLNFILLDISSEIPNTDTIQFNTILLFKTSLFFMMFTFNEIVILLIQISFSLFKLSIAFYLLWLIVDLFILKVLCLKESNCKK